MVIGSVTEGSVTEGSVTAGSEVEGSVPFSVSEIPGGLIWGDVVMGSFVGRLGAQADRIRDRIRENKRSFIKNAPGIPGLGAGWKGDASMIAEKETSVKGENVKT